MPNRDSTNPYATPAAAVADPQSAGSPVHFFPVGTKKLILLSALTWGIYEIYWFYKNWEYVRHNAKENIWPIPRALFSGLFAYFFFTRLKRRAQALDVPSSFSAGGLAIAFLVLSNLWRLPDPYWLVSMFTFLPLLPVRRVIEDINQKHAPEADLNTRITGANIAWMCLGGLLLLAGLAGMFLES